MPGAAELAHPTGPASPAGAIPPAARGAVEAPRQTYRDPTTGRMARGYKGEMPPAVVGHTAEGGPMYERTPSNIKTFTDSNGTRWAERGNYKVSIPKRITDVEEYAGPKLDEQERLHRKMKSRGK